MPLPDLSRLLHHPIPSDGAADFHALPDLSLLLRHPIPPDGAADFSALVRPRVGAGPSMNLPGPQLPLQNHQPLPSDPQLPLWSPPDTSAQRAPPSIRPAPPHHFSGAGGSPIDDPDSDLDDDLHADENDLFSAPLGNALGMLGGGDADMDDDEGMELDPSRRRVISLDSPPSGSTRLPALPLRWTNPCSFSRGSSRRQHTTVARCLAQLPSPLLVTLVHSRNCGMGPCDHSLFGG
ncbi:hypothetical protein DFJ58DRAFT_727240 [Suillus subalutaceus]|uniref:uncharacterized protein n=1 Tax=Suillus subalutaceus TaxID=48586 RepID=UPI001B875D8B|nr:uncharacterized protein DFJ58DRAFT_727240 [Suillus subalutaceus]KAG1856401.1 hypothetical protein DFJ58DRAFT_727240 [Suillus subalutaceus]